MTAGGWWRERWAGGEDAEQLVEALAALFGGKPGQKVHFREAHDLQAQLVEVVIVAGQKQTRAVDFSDLDADLVQLARRISDLKADLLDQPLERNSEIPHSFFLLHPLCSAIPKGNTVYPFLYYNRDGRQKQQFFQESFLVLRQRLHPGAKTI